MKMKNSRIAAMTAALVLCAVPLTHTIISPSSSLAITADAATSTHLVKIQVTQPPENEADYGDASKYTPLQEAGREVQLRKGASKTATYTAVTDENGIATFPEVAEAEYAIYIAAYNNFGESLFSVGTYPKITQNYTFKCPVPTAESTKPVINVYLTDLNGEIPLGVEDAVVKLYDSTGSTLVATTTTDANGEASFGHQEDGTYVIKLDTVPKGYDNSTTPEQTITINHSDYSAYRVGIPLRESVFTQKLYVGSSAGTDTPDGDATFIGAKFDVLKDGQVQTTFTVTEEDGYLGELVLDEDDITSNWTIQMVTAPQGYVFNSAPATIDMSVFPVNQVNIQTFAMLPITGKFKIAAAPGTTFNITLQSDTSKSPKKYTATTDSRTKSSVVLMNEMLPYGTYSIQNSKTKEVTTAVIDTDGKIVEVNTVNSGAPILYDLDLSVYMTAFTYPHDAGDTNPSHLKFGLFRNDEQVATYTYSQLTKNQATYHILGYDRDAKWTLKQIDTNSGIGVEDVVFSDRASITSAPNLTGFSYQLARPGKIYGNIEISGTAGDTVQYYLTSGRSAEALNEKGDVSTFGTFTLGVFGKKTVRVPYGKYTIHDTTTNKKISVSVTEQGTTVLAELPENPNPVTFDDSRKYTLTDYTGNVVAEGTYIPGMDIPRPDSPYGIYNLTITTETTGENGVTYVSTEEYPSVKISEDGEVKVMNNTIAGDYDHNGTVDMNDAVALKDFIMKRDQYGTVNSNWESCDLNNDGRVNLYDYMYLLRLLHSQSSN